MNQLRSLPISHLEPLLINHLVWYGAWNIMLFIITVGFCILHDVLYDMGIMKPPLVLYWQCQFLYSRQWSAMAQLICAMILESIN